MTIKGCYYLQQIAEGRFILDTGNCLEFYNRSHRELTMTTTTTKLQQPYMLMSLWWSKKDGLFGQANGHAESSSPKC